MARGCFDLISSRFTRVHPSENSAAYCLSAYIQVIPTGVRLIPPLTILFQILLNVKPALVSTTFSGRSPAHAGRAGSVGATPCGCPVGWPAGAPWLKASQSSMAITFSLFLCFLTHSGFVWDTTRAASRDALQAIETHGHSPLLSSCRGDSTLSSPRGDAEPNRGQRQRLAARGFPTLQTFSDGGLLAAGPIKSPQGRHEGVEPRRRSRATFQGWVEPRVRYLSGVARRYVLPPFQGRDAADTATWAYYDADFGHESTRLANVNIVLVFVYVVVGPTPSLRSGQALGPALAGASPGPTLGMLVSCNRSSFIKPQTSRGSVREPRSGGIP